MFVYILFSAIEPDKLNTSPAKGQLAKDQLAKDQFSATSFLHEPYITEILTHSDGVIRGIATLDTELFIVGSSKLQNIIEVYNSNSFTLIRQLQIPALEKTLAITACPHHNCLYVSTDANKSILHRFDIGNNSTSNWPLNGKCISVSATINRSVLATYEDAKRLREYTTNGVSIRDIMLNIRDDDRACDSAQLSNGNFVVCLVGSQHRVCIVDTSGHVLKSYGGAAGSGDGQLNGLFKLAVGKFDNVLVADYYNKRVVFLSDGLTRVGFVHTPGYQLSCPRALWLDEPRGSLYIGRFCSVIVVKSNGAD